MHEFLALGVPQAVLAECRKHLLVAKLKSTAWQVVGVLAHTARQSAAVEALVGVPPRTWKLVKAAENGMNGCIGAIGSTRAENL